MPRRPRPHSAAIATRMAWGRQSPADDLAQLVGLVRKSTTKNLVVMPNRKLDSASASALADEVAKAPALESIVVASATLGPDAAAALVRAAFACPTVNRLNLSFPVLGDSDLSPLLAEVKKAGTAEGAGTGLANLELLLPLVTEVGAVALAEALKPEAGCAPAVRGLHLTRMQLGVAGLRALADAAGAGGLLHLKLDGCGHFEKGAEELAGLSAPGSALQSLHLTGMKLRPVAPEDEEEQPSGDVKPVGRSAPPAPAGLPAATRSSPPVSAADAEPATEAELAALRGLGALQSLSHLCLNGAGLDEACGRAIAQGVVARAAAMPAHEGEGLGPLLQLVLDHNPLGDEGAAALIEELRPAGAAATDAATAAGAGAAAATGAGALAADDSTAAVLTAEAAARWGLGVSLALLVTGAAGATARAAASVWQAQVAAALAGGAGNGVLFRAVDMGANRGVGEAAMSGLIRAGGRGLGQVGVMGNVEFETENDGTEEGVGVLGEAVGDAMRHFHALLSEGSTVAPELRLPRGSAGLTGPGVDLSMLYLGGGGCKRVIQAVAEAVGATSASVEGKAADALAAAAEAAGNVSKEHPEEPKEYDMAAGATPPTVSPEVLHHSLLHSKKPHVLSFESGKHLGTQGRHVYLLLAGNDLGAEGRTVGLRLVKWLHLFG